MSIAVFINLKPDNYHGDPMVDSVCPPDPFPDIPDKDYIFDCWSSSGEGEDENESFEEYGDSEVYYAIYLLILEDENVLKSLPWMISAFSYSVSSVYSGSTSDKLVKWLKEQDGVEEAYTII